MQLPSFDNEIQFTACPKSSDSSLFIQKKNDIFITSFPQERIPCLIDSDGNEFIHNFAREVRKFHANFHGNAFPPLSMDFFLIFIITQQSTYLGILGDRVPLLWTGTWNFWYKYIHVHYYYHLIVRINAVVKETRSTPWAFYVSGYWPLLDLSQRTYLPMRISNVRTVPSTLPAIISLLVKHTDITLSWKVSMIWNNDENSYVNKIK